MNNKFNLHSKFEPAGEQPQAIEKLISGLENNLTKQVLLGVTGCGKTFTIANVIAKVNRPTLIIAHNKTLAAQLYGEMKSFFPKNSVEYFVSYYDYYQPEAYVPSSNTYIEKDASVNEHVEQMRLSATKAILERSDTIIVSTVSAIYGLGDPELYFSMILHLSNGDKINQREIIKKLVAMRYRRNDVDLLRGTFRVRGDVIDVFPADAEKEALRIELFDDEVEKLSYFDPLLNKTLYKVPRATVFPKTHYVTPEHNVKNIVDQISKDLGERLKVLRENEKLVEAQRLEERTRYDMEMLLELGFCNGIENYSRYLSNRKPGEPPPTLMDYLPKDALLIIDESHVTVPQIGAMYKGDRSRKETLVQYGFRLPSALDNRPLRFDEFEKIAPETIYVSATPSDFELVESKQTVELLVRPTGLIDPEVEIKPASTQIEDLLVEIKSVVENKERVLVTTLTKRMAEDLSEYLTEQNIKVRYLHSDIGTVERVEILRDLRLGVFDVLVGINLLREGLDLPEVSLVAILDADKEGFLRSRQSLIQTSGRAARNLHGKVIMYADKITKSMRAALDEMSRRRTIQKEFNKKHNITPKSISKAVDDIMEGAHASEENIQQELSDKEIKELSNYLALPAKKLDREIKTLERKMAKHAKALEFEEAAAVRDKIERIKQEVFK